MGIRKHQEVLLRSLQMAAKRQKTLEIVYKSELLGYLPFGYYHWLEVDGKELKVDSPDTLYADLSALVKSGWLKLVKESEFDDDDLHVYYELVSE